MAKCIYCKNKEADAREHYLPACLGEFLNYELLYNRLCNDCNNEIGKLDEQFCRCGPESFIRRIKGIKGRKKHKKVNPFYRKSSGGKYIEMEMNDHHNNKKIFCEIIEGTDDAIPARQIIFQDISGKFFSILITDNMKDHKDLQKALLENNLENCKPIECWATVDEREWIEKLLNNYNIKFNWKFSPLDEKKVTKKFTVKFEVNDKYFRAIAKIGFHYFLKYFPQFTGFEIEFEEIKNFIDKGDEIEKFVEQIEGSFIYGLKPGSVTTDKLCHFIGVNKTRNFIIAYLQFFVGPEFGPSFYYKVNIGKNPERIIYPQNIGHQFVYFDQKDKKGFIGRMDPLRSFSRGIL